MKTTRSGVHSNYFHSNNFTWRDMAWNLLRRYINIIKPMYVSFVNLPFLVSVDSSLDLNFFRPFQDFLIVHIQDENCLALNIFVPSKVSSHLLKVWWWALWVLILNIFIVIVVLTWGGSALAHLFVFSPYSFFLIYIFHCFFSVRKHSSFILLVMSILLSLKELAVVRLLMLFNQSK